MKELEKVFIGRGEVKGFYFEQVARSENAYIYKVRCHLFARPYYEVFERRINTQFGNVSYPKSKAFGRWAWTTYDEDEAWRIFENLSLRFSIEVTEVNQQLLTRFFGERKEKT